MKAWAVTTLGLAAVIGIGLAMQPAVGQERTRTSSTGGTTAAADDVKFIENATSGGLHEVHLGQLATERANDPEVKKFGEMMVTDHSKLNKELTNVAQQMGVKLPTQENAEHQAERQKFMAMKGQAFDQAYMKHMVDDDKKDVEDFKKASESAKDSRLRNFASKTLPVVREHLTKAEQIASRLMVK
jgi:putative membrane protein